MLTEKEREWILTDRSRYSRKDTTTKRVRDYKIRKKALVMLDDLTLLARALSPNQHRQVFTLESLSPLIKALSEYANEERERSSKNDKDVIVYNEELFKIGFDLGNTLLIMAKALVTEPYRKLIWGTDRQALPTRQDIKGLETAFYAIKGKERK